jgi:hypothetical protein
MIKHNKKINCDNNLETEGVLFKTYHIFLYG